ncbi:amidase family protein [Sulfitobacter sp. HNIBRBA3233]|uniref:amidase family protein n=1 Tax=Sulfitobacter marinivivus TaxID=3158558 RepID=UPI0032DE710D
MAALTATRMSQGLEAATLDPVALTEEVYDRVDTHGDDAIYIDQTRERAMAEAEASRIRQRAGLRLHPLDGVPTAWKDLFDLRGRVTTAASTVLRRNAPAQSDAAVVATSARAGVICTGTVNMTEMAYSGIGLNPHYGTPRNPRAPKGEARSPGGSSSGSGVVVAAGIVPVSMGSDTGGSVRIPASFNGIVGYKTSSGRYPMDGVFPLSPTLDTIGPLAQTAADCALFDAMLRGRTEPEASPTAPERFEFVIPDGIFFEALQPEVAANFAATVERLEQAGARVRRIQLPELQEVLDLAVAHGPLAGAESWGVHHERLATDDRAAIDPRVVARIELGKTMTALDLMTLQSARVRLMAQTAAAIGDAIVLCPTTPTTAMRTDPLAASQEVFFEHNGLTLRNTSIGNFLGWCGVQIPNGMDADAMPTGFLMSAPSGRDTQILAAAMGCEEIIRG